MNYNTAIFDLDGTLIDSLEDLRDSVNTMLEEKIYPQRTRNEIRLALGHGVNHLILKSLPEGSSENEIKECAEIFKNIYAEKMHNKTAPYKGIKTLLKELKKRDIKIAVTSNKHEAAVKALCKQLFGDYVDIALGSETGTARKPEPDIVFKAISLLKADITTALYIGDSETDIHTAKNAGVTSVGVTWGYRDRDTLLEAGAEYLIDSPAELLKLFD